MCTSFAFQYCNSLTTVTINAANLETYGENAFLNANSGMKIYVPYGSGNTYKTGWPDYASKIEELEDPNATYSVKLAENTDDATNWTITLADATDPEKGEYQMKPRGRVFFSPADDQYIIAVGTWIDESPEAIN